MTTTTATVCQNCGVDTEYPGNEGLTISDDGHCEDCIAAAATGDYAVYRERRALFGPRPVPVDVDEIHDVWSRRSASYRSEHGVTYADLRDLWEGADSALVPTDDFGNLTDEGAATLAQQWNATH